MAWRRQGNRPLLEAMMVRLPTHICVTRSQWVNDRYFLWNHSETMDASDGWLVVYNWTMHAVGGEMFSRDHMRSTKISRLWTCLWHPCLNNRLACSEKRIGAIHNRQNILHLIGFDLTKGRRGTESHHKYDICTHTYIHTHIYSKSTTAIHTYILWTKISV